MQVLPSGGLTCSLYDYEVTVCNSAAGAVLGYKGEVGEQTGSFDVNMFHVSKGVVKSSARASSYFAAVSPRPHATSLENYDHSSFLKPIFWKICL